MSKVRIWFRRPDAQYPENMINASFVLDDSVQGAMDDMLRGGILVKNIDQPLKFIPAHQITLIEECEDTAGSKQKYPYVCPSCDTHLGSLDGYCPVCGWDLSKRTLAAEG